MQFSCQFGGGGEVFYCKKSKLGRFRNSKPNFRRLFRLVMLCLIHVSLLSRQASVTCQHGCSTDCQPQNVSNEHIFLEVAKFLSQLITKFDCVVAGSLPKAKMLIPQMHLCFLIKVK